MPKTLGLAFLLVLVTLSGCGKAPPEGPRPTAGDRPAPATLPAPAAMVAEPPPQPKKVGAIDLDPLDADDLAGLANQAAEERNYPLAVAAQYWHVKKAGTGQYDLACYSARVQQRDAAFHWLQKAASEEGVDPTHAAQDDDLAALRADSRYPAVLEFLRDTAAYWREHAAPVTLLYLPKGHDKAKPLPVLLCLHGRGSTPKNFFGDESQKLADRLGFPVVCVSGTRPAGPRSFVWAVDPATDAKRLDAALAEVADRISVAPGKVVAIGFSEGAQVGLDAAVRDPDKYAGALAFSPGAEFQLAGLAPHPKVKDRRYVVSIGLSEAPGNRELARKDRDWLTKAGANVEYKTFRGGHQLPPDFWKDYPAWVKFVLDGQ